MKVEISHHVPEEHCYQYEIFDNVEYMSIDENWVFFIFKKDSPEYKKYNDGTLYVGFDIYLDYIEIR